MFLEHNKHMTNAREPLHYCLIFTARKRSFRQGNVFTRVCHSVHKGSLYDVTSCLTTWSHVPSGGFSVQGRCLRYRSRIWSRGAQVLRPKVADIAKWSRASKVSNLRLVSRAHLRTLESFGFLMLKYAFSHILETLFL